MSDKEPMDAILLDRVIQPAFDKLWHLTGVPSTLVCVHAWIAANVFMVARYLIDLYSASPGDEAVTAGDTAMLVFILAMNTLIIIRANGIHQAWKRKGFEENGTRTYPSDRYTMGAWRFFFVLLSIGLLIPGYIEDLVWGADQMEQLKGLFYIALNLSYHGGLYGFAVCPPSGPRQRRRTVTRQAFAGSS